MVLSAAENDDDFSRLRQICTWFASRVGKNRCSAQYRRHFCRQASQVTWTQFAITACLIALLSFHWYDNIRMTEEFAIGSKNRHKAKDELLNGHVATLHVVSCVDGRRRTYLQRKGGYLRNKTSSIWLKIRRFLLESHGTIFIRIEEQLIIDERACSGSVKTLSLSTKRNTFVSPGQKMVVCVSQCVETH